MPKKTIKVKPYKHREPITMSDLHMLSESIDPQANDEFWQQFFEQHRQALQRIEDTLKEANDI